MITAPRAAFLLLLFIGALRLAAAPAFNFAAAIADARRTWGADARELAELLHKLRGAAGKAAGAEQKLNEARGALARLEREFRDAMDDVRNGDFCDGCGRTRRDLLAKGEQFPHPGQSRRPARPEDYEKVKNDFNGRMDIQRRLIARYEPELKDARAEIDAAHFRYMVLRPAFHSHIADEQQHRLGKWLDERATANDEIKAAHEAVAAAMAKLKAAQDGDQARAAQAEVKQLEARLTQRITNARFAEERARQEERSFRQDVLASLDSLGKIAEPIPDAFGISGWFISKSIRNTPRAVGYTVDSIIVGNPPGATAAPSSELQRLLEGTGKSQPAPKPGDKSVKDLLEGK